MTRLVYRLMGWRSEVEDVVQDVFLAAFKRWNGFRKDSSAWTWLAAIAINRCRSYRRRKVLELRWLRMAHESWTGKWNGNVAPDETSYRVRQAVAALPARDREVVVLYYLEEMSVAEIGRVIGASTSAIDVRLHRARARLREILGESPE